MEWEDVGKGLKNFGKSVSDKVRDTADVMAISHKMRNEKSLMRKAYEQIGMRFCEQNEIDAVDGEYAKLMKDAATAKAAAERYQQQIDAIWKK